LIAASKHGLLLLIPIFHPVAVPAANARPAGRPAPP